MSKEAKDILEKIPSGAGDSMDVIGLIFHDIIDKTVGLILRAPKKPTEK